MKISIFSHGHAELMAGGAERAAYTLFEYINDNSQHKATLVASTTPEHIGHDGTIGSFRGRKNEILWASPGNDHFTQSSLNYGVLKHDIDNLLTHIEPDIVHFHHYTTVGVDALRIVKEEFGLPVVLTLHEYMLICNHNGQMVKTNMKLCRTSSPAECHACFPGISSGKFFVRKKMLESNLAFVDHFIAPSQFLLDRYVDWGIDRDRISMIENLLPKALVEAAKKPRSNIQDNDGEGRKILIGYFGQINPYKGISLIFDALLVLPKQLRKRVQVVIFGANLEIQEASFREMIGKKLDEVGNSVALYGSYDNKDVVDLMRGMDWCIIPSIWWENSPIVIQEAKASGVPMLASNIGGMKEKVIDRETGIHFLAGSSFDLARNIERILKGQVKIVVPKQDLNAINADLLNKHVSIYCNLV